MTSPHDHRSHPLYEAQVELEKAMMHEGADAFRDRVVEAKNHREMTKLKPVRGLVTDWLPCVAESLQHWVQTYRRRKGGPAPIALSYVEQTDRWTASLVGLRCLLNSISTERTGLMAVASEIGRTLEHECQCRAWERRDERLLKAITKAAPDKDAAKEARKGVRTFKPLQARMDKQGATGRHKARVNVNRFNALLDEDKFDFEWAAWSKEVHFRVGVALLEAIMMGTGWIEIIPDPNHEWKPGRVMSPRLVVSFKPNLLEWLGDTLDKLEESLPVFQPTIIPPKHWSNTKDGGYFTPYVRTPRLIRFKASQEEQREFAAQEYDGVEMPVVYETINFLQDTSWRVNKRVLAVAAECWAKDMRIAGLPLREDLETPQKPLDFEESPEAQKAWKRKATHVMRENALRHSRLRGTKRTIEVATKYEEFQELYFPHILDFRGRTYPVPLGMQPQGDDLARGLLEFAVAKPVYMSEAKGESALWLAVQLASAWGIDKVSFEDRVQWVSEREDDWRRIAANPLHEQLWAEQDKPWQCLAAIFDWVGFLDHGDGYMSFANIAVDGTCNGIQHLSALTRDAVAGAYVNLTPGEKPQDIYQFVADDLQETFERISQAGGLQGEYADYWLGFKGANGKLPRSLTKRQVMVVPYGGTKDAFFKYAREWLKDYGAKVGETATEEEFKLQGQRVAFLVLHMTDSVNRTVKGAVKVMKWLQDCAKACSLGNQPIVFTTPTGFPVRHFYGTVEEKQINALLDGETYKIRHQTHTKQLDTRSQLRGIAPNFIHSLDADALRQTVKLAIDAGNITHFSAVHDAYGTHAADMWELAAHLRQAFVMTHSANALDSFRASCVAILTDYFVGMGKDPLEGSEKADEWVTQAAGGPLEMGDLDINDVLKSDYFFA